MSEVLKRLAELEEVLVNSAAATAREGLPVLVHRHTMLVAREAYTLGLATGYNPNVTLAAHAWREFPLSPKRVLREEPDPERPWRWRFLEHLEVNMGMSRSAWGPVIEEGVMVAPTPERNDLWHSLKHNPYREVPDNGDD
jgi:hypothetical protein